MKGSTHALLGVVSLVGLQGWIPLPPDLPRLGLALVAAGVGALLPDLDADESLIRHETHTARSDGPLGWLVSWIMPSHRGLTHSGLACLLIVLLAKQWPTYWPTALAIGYVSHIVADMLTRQGVPLLWPVHWRLSLLPIVTGGPAESVIAMGAGGWLVVAVLGKLGISLWPVWQSLRTFIASYL
jgi:inner membrane protein